MPMKDGEISKASEALLKKVYYDEGMTMGRDALFHYMTKKYPKTHPSKNEIEAWLNKQRLQQEFAQTRKGGMTDRFKAIRPWYHTSVDLIDFQNKPAPGNYRYVVVLIDNFSRYVYTEKITEKTPRAVKTALEKILKQIGKDYPERKIHSMIADDGGEFKGEVLDLLKKNGIQKRRILGGNPQQNGMVERANGKLKMILAKNKRIRGGSWASNLELATKNYNQQLNRGIAATPAEAVLFNEEEQKILRAHNEEVYPINPEAVKKYEDLKVGARVRIKLNKGALDKSSTPNWSSKIYTIASLIPSRGTIARKYTITGKDSDLRFSRNDIQEVDEVDEIPTKRKVATRKATADEQELTRGAFTRARELEKKRAVTARTASSKGKEAETTVQKKPPPKSAKTYVYQRFVGKRTEKGKVLWSVKFKGFSKPFEYTTAQLKKNLGKKTFDEFVADFRNQGK